MTDTELRTSGESLNQVAESARTRRSRRHLRERRKLGMGSRIGLLAAGLGVAGGAGFLAKSLVTESSDSPEVKAVLVASGWDAEQIDVKDDGSELVVFGSTDDHDCSRSFTIMRDGDNREIQATNYLEEGGEFDSDGRPLVTPERTTITSDLLSDSVRTQLIGKVAAACSQAG